MNSNRTITSTDIQDSFGVSLIHFRNNLIELSTELWHNDRPYGINLLNRAYSNYKVLTCTCGVPGWCCDGFKYLDENMFCLLFTGISVVILWLSIYRETEMRNSILAQVLDQSARARCKCGLIFVFWILDVTEISIGNERYSLLFFFQWAILHWLSQRRQMRLKTILFRWLDSESWEER